MGRPSEKKHPVYTLIQRDQHKSSSHIRMNGISCQIIIRLWCSPNQILMATYFHDGRQNWSPTAQNRVCRRTCPFASLGEKLQIPVGFHICEENRVDTHPRCVLMCFVPPVKGTFSVGAQTILVVHTLHHAWSDHCGRGGDGGVDCW